MSLAIVDFLTCSNMETLSAYVSTKSWHHHLIVCLDWHNRGRTTVVLSLMAIILRLALVVGHDRRLFWPNKPKWNLCLWGSGSLCGFDLNSTIFAFKSQRIIELIVCNPFDFVTDLADVPVAGDILNQIACWRTKQQRGRQRPRRQRAILTSRGKRRRSSALEWCT